MKIYKNLDEARENLNNKGSPEYYRLYEFFKHMALCHTVQLDVDPTGKVTKQANSPDELALVDGSEAVDFKFTERTPQYIGVDFKYSPKSKKTERYETILEFPFDSDRKRMSMIMKNIETKELILFSKGADTTMLPRVNLEADERSIVDDHLYKFACTGLRTLVMAQKSLDERSYSKWLARYDKVTTSGDANKKQL